jgi:hypothetical protein
MTGVRAAFSRHDPKTQAAVDMPSIDVYLATANKSFDTAYLHLRTLDTDIIRDSIRVPEEPSHVAADTLSFDPCHPSPYHVTPKPTLIPDCSIFSYAEQNQMPIKIRRSDCGHDSAAQEAVSDHLLYIFWRVRRKTAQLPRLACACIHPSSSMLLLYLLQRFQHISAYLDGVRNLTCNRSAAKYTCRYPRCRKPPRAGKTAA